MKNHIVTLAIPVYGVEKYIERCARSLFEQTYKDIEYIFIDDCSSDNSIAILKTIIEQYPVRATHVRIVRHEVNKGLAATRNTAVTNCTTEWIYHIDSDDWLEPNAIELLINKQIESGADIVSGQVMRHTPNNDILLVVANADDKKEFLLGTLGYDFHHILCSRLIRTSLYEGGMIRAEEGVNLGEDWQVMPRLAWNAQKIAHLDEITYHYDCSNASSYVNVRAHSFKRNRLEQDYRSLEIVQSFFSDKDEIYINKLKESEAKMLYSQLYLSAHGADKVYFNRVKEMLKKVELYLPKRSPIKRFVDNNYYLLRLSFPVRDFMVKARS